MIDLNNITVDLLRMQSGVLLFARVVSIIWLAPIFGSASIPNTVKAGFSLILTIVVYPFIDFENTVFLETVLGFLFGITKEIAIGMVIGYISVIVFSSVRLTGQILGRQMGFAIANVVDPLSNEQMSVMAHMLYFITVLTFLGANIHHFFITAIFRSLELIPLGAFSPEGALMEYVIKLTAGLFVIAVKLGGPLVAMLLVVSAAMGIVSKTVPQLNVLVAGMPVRIGVGLIGFLVMVPVYATTMHGLLVNMVKDIEVVIRLMV